jgi:hypothetical protein
MFCEIPNFIMQKKSKKKNNPDFAYYETVMKKSKKNFN